MILSTIPPYICYLARHKWHVMVECFRRGLYWRGIKHDWTKLLPAEFAAYAESFYGRGGPVPLCEIVDHFDRAWLHHQHNNSHHWQHWVLKTDGGKTKVVEMYCDWVGAGKSINGNLSVYEWYMRNRDIILLHPDTRALVEGLIYGWKTT